MDLENRKFNMSPIKTEDKVLFFGTAALSMTMIGYSLSKGTGAMMRFINKWEIPSVIRETSVTSVYDYLKNPVIAIRKIGERRALKESLNKLVFTEQINNKYQELVGTTTYAATQKLRTNRRNVMVYGPPGNGKSSFVRKIAINSGVHYAVINGIDLMSRNQKLVPEIQKLFDWIYKRRSNPFVLLVLKADEFFNNRTNEHIREATCIFSEKLKNNNFNSLMVLMTADNQIYNIKINDYINDFVFILTPEKEQKLKLIRLYAEKYILSVEDKYRKELESIYDEIASATKNMSCQDIEMLVKLWKILLYESKSDKNPKQIILECCYRTIQDNKKKVKKCII
ncbi:ATPase family AAA domain-containing protein 3-like [Daktulosphaira vitifoliae]|uniref:ATPase family AAA domain-containing protein 3-like n=1 Tax=Daktulosphaira vitifoliae TaxID=58002 RepID=UPI0021AA066D|nr:ATPase family AAA domain-containing protein 3-like [Daktulosphaira vitifoliae]